MAHYFETPAGEAPEFDVTMTLWDRTVTLTSAPGVFSGRRLDPGTAVLLRACLPPTGPGPFLDLGCGLGPIGLALALHTAAEIWALDVNHRALELTRRNAGRLGVADRLHAVTPDGIDPALRFAEIWSNPPIRIGKPALHELLTTWLTRLTPTGRAHLVVAKNLGADSLARWLGDGPWSVERRASARGYRVLDVGLIAAPDKNAQE